jgi:hypothetical protein
LKNVDFAYAHADTKESWIKLDYKKRFNRRARENREITVKR